MSLSFEYIKNIVNVGKRGRLIRYALAGVLNVIITWVSYSILVLMDIDPFLCNAISWIIGVLVAFILNKGFVFGSKSMDVKTVGKEGTLFAFSRIFTGLIAIFGFPILYGLGMNWELFGIDGLPAKCVISFVEIALNYVLSRFCVFKVPSEE